MNLYKYVSESINNKLGFAANLEVPRNRAFGDFSTNAAMVMAKSAGKNPRELAAEILPQLQELDFVADASIAGPGFINLKLRDDFIWNAAILPHEMHTEQPLVIDMDYGSYNVAKSLHIGHMRTSIVGDTLNRIAKYIGHKTISYNHIGDWGRSMGLVIAWIKRIHPDWPFFQPDFNPDADYSKYTISIEELDTYYPAAAALAKTDEEFMETARVITAELQRGHAGYTALYNVFLPISMESMLQTVHRLNIMPFDRNLGERNAAQYTAPVEKMLREKNLLVKSEGAEVIVVKKDTDTAPMPPVMFYNSRGAVPYDATDIMALYYRKITDNPDKIIYLTDIRQKLHFEQLFRVAELTGLFPPENLEHIGYGTINGTDGKPFKTRDGSAAGLNDIIEMVTEAARKRVADSDKKLSDDTINAIALAALKFNDLMHDLRSDYIFDPESVTSFEGRTGPYILYTAVRLNSVLKRAGDTFDVDTVETLTDDERNLLVGTLDFERTVQSAFDNRATDMIANYAYDLCQLANSFYHNCPILRDDVDEVTRGHRLKIARIARDTLATAIDLMGLKIPDEM
ncbi:MAG TPA: arginine--tRNA ligase [Candidatus Enterousia intestinigallinarum]|uniref:Arginine--tRNA ligase n=1 Tax=Candidatus Enterousia intestinigallinarum TaxID=2840790 RepID=A0A9D1FGB0_9PROT|nr:arginine--tRNA ligase [Candidatus Enterousia intestinigallinarum]